MLEFPDMNVAQLQSLQEGIDMINEGVVRELEESRQAGLAEGHTMGVAEGRTKGLAEGRTLGVAEGHTMGVAEGRTKGLAEGQRSLLRRQIVWKFGDATAERCADELSGLGDNGRMEELGRLVLDCRTGRGIPGKALKRLVSPQAGHARPLRNAPLHSASAPHFGIESVHNYVMSLITRHNWVLRLGLVLLLAGQVFSVAHASEFGRTPHEHDGVACIAILTDEPEGLVPTANLTASEFIALVADVPRPAIEAPPKCLRSIRPPATGPPSI